MTLKQMGRQGHKPGCQCIICIRMRAKAGLEVQPLIEVEPEPATTVGSLQIGQLFKYKAGPLEPKMVYKKLNDVPTQGICIVADPSSVDEAIQLPRETVVELMPQPRPVQDME